MYIRIEFNDIDSPKTKETQQIFFSSPNGMFLSSLNAHMISSKELRELFSNTVVFWSPVTSVETYLQCIARIDRYGQKNKMTVVHLQGSPVERRMYEVLQNKVDAHEKLVDLYKSELGLGE